MLMLDTDSVSYFLRGQGRVGSRIAEHQPSDLCISAITAAELRFGADRRESVRRQLRGTLRTIASDLARRGTPIGPLDVLIAAHAMALGATLVTNNVKHFSRVRGLDVENWL